MAEPELKKVLQQTVQEIPNARVEGDSTAFWYMSQRGFALPPWATRERERMLRVWYRHEYNWMGQSAIAGLTKKVKATSWEISGPATTTRSRRVRYFQDVLRQADFGRGWGSLIGKVILDLLRQDGGAYIELIAPGNPLKAPTGAVTGLAYLDSLRCFPTPDPEYPVIYYDRKGKMHLMHRSRVVHLVDMVDGDESNPGYGLCALSRAISIVMREIHMTRYVEAKLDDKPPPGYMVASNLNEGNRNAAFEKYRQEQSADDSPAWGRTIWFYSVDPSAPAKLESVTYSQAPDKFDFKQYTELDANAWALALNTDVQEIWQLTGGNLGSGQQSEILHQKSQGKAYGDILTMLERALNDVLPEELEFQFKKRDHLESQNEAAVAQAWTGVSQSAPMTDDEKRRMLANKVDAIKDAITDANGEIVRYHDADVEPEPQEQVVDDSTPQDAETPAQTAQTQTAEDAKALQATRIGFEAAFADLLTAARSGDMDRRRFGMIGRDLIRRFGRDAYRDGLKDGGVESGELDSEDESHYTALLAQQSAYVTGLGDELYKEGGITDAEAVYRPGMWWNKSISPFYDAGRLSADANGIYEFTGNDGAESCTTCKRLKGQRHRFKVWVERRYRPRVDTDNFDCKGYHCEHVLAKTTDPARGRFTR